MMPQAATGPGRKVVMTTDEVERLMLITMDLDRYEAEVIPDLRDRVRDLTVALEGLVAAAHDASQSNRDEALATGRRVLAKGRPG
jgi:hypothetical protein